MNNERGNGVINHDRVSGLNLNPERKYQNSNGASKWQEDKNRKYSLSSGSDENTPQDKDQEVSKCFYFTCLAIWMVALEVIGFVIGFTTNSG